MRVVWYPGRVSYQCDRHAYAMQRGAVRAGLPLRMSDLEAW